jgi:molecular chaperone DnaK (HSP70)
VYQGERESGLQQEARHVRPDRHRARAPQIEAAFDIDANGIVNVSGRT